VAYSAALRRGIGQVRGALQAVGLVRQDERFRRHGVHSPSADAPLVLVACSGGRDSMALAAVAHIVCSSLGLRCGAAIVDHGIDAHSGDVTARTIARCRELGLSPVMSRRIDIGDVAGRGVEAAAREARYDALVGMAGAADSSADAPGGSAAAILLAHTRDDQAETVLIGLSRSGGLDAVVGMPERFERQGVRFLRPWLGLTRAETTSICRELRLCWWDDPTNGDAIPSSQPLGATYPLRSRIRHDLMPALARVFGHDPAPLLSSGARSARLDADYLHAQAADLAARSLVVDDRVAHLDAARLASSHPALRRRVIVAALRSLDVPVATKHVEAIDRLIADWHGQGDVHLPSDCSASRQGQVIEVCKDRPHANR